MVIFTCAVLSDINGEIEYISSGLRESVSEEIRRLTEGHGFADPILLVLHE